MARFKQDVVPIYGGLELVTDKLSVSPGTAQYMMNYEVGAVRGIRRIDGFSKWDGRPSPARKAFYASITDWPTFSGLFAANEVVTFYYLDSSGVATASVPVMIVATTHGVSDPSGGGPGVPLYWVQVTLVPLAPMDVYGGGIVGVTSTTSGGVAFESPSPFTGVTSTFFDYSLSYSSWAALVTQLPGGAKTRIPGVHFFGDRDYAVVDLVALEITPSYNNFPEGAALYAVGQTASIGTIALSYESSTAGNVVLELFDYSGGTLTPGVDLYWMRQTGNLVANGSFAAAASASDWAAIGAGWTVGSGVASAVAGAGSNLDHALTAEAYFTYEITYTLACSAGTITPSFGGATLTTRSTSGTFTETVYATSAAVLRFAKDAAFAGSVDDVSVKIKAANLLSNGAFASGATGWTLGAGWTVPGTTAIGTATSDTLTSSTLLGVSGRRYLINYTITRSAGSVTVSIGGVSGTTRSAAGTYQDYITASGAGALTFTGGSFTGTVDDITVYAVGGVADFVAEVNPLRAALYYADWDSTGGWTRQDMGRLLRYDEGTTSDVEAFFLPYTPAGFIAQLDAAEATDTGWIGADGWEEDGAGPGWTGAGAGDLTSDDGITVASTTGASGVVTKLLKATWSNAVLDIPAGAIVRGIEVAVRRSASHSAGAFVTDYSATMEKTGPVFSTRSLAKAGNLPTAETEVTYGDATELWGLRLNPGDINDGGLKFRINFQQWGTSPAPNVIVDQIKIKVHYQPQARKAYVYSQNAVPTDQEVEVVHYTVSEGTSSGADGKGDRKGILVIKSAITPTDVAKPWQFAPGMEIRTETGGAGALLAFVASDDVPCTLPSSYLVADADARYTFSSARPYARDDADVFFACNGAEYASMFGDGYMLPIQTGLLEQFEKPRHAMWAGNYLALGYGVGTLALSDLGSPLTYLGSASIAAEIGASDRVVGLEKLQGDTLGVFTERTIFGLQGTDPTNVRRIEISPASGAIEYTVATVGDSPMFTNYRGIGTIQTTANYGDFAKGLVSWQATPWLLERIQSSTRDEAGDRKPICAYTVPSSNQYRLLFRDGWQATLTIGVGEGENPITTQRFYGDRTDRDGSAIRMLGLTTGVTSTGKDVAFATFDIDPESSRYRYVFQLNQGTSFDGVEIVAQWMSQPMHLGAPFYLKKLQQLGLYGKAYGFAGFKIRCATDLTDPTSDEVAYPTASADYSAAYMEAFGSAASSTERNWRLLTDLPAEGEDFTVMIESITATELPHTIQAMVLRYETEEPSK